jgi:hypothetical protein
LVEIELKNNSSIKNPLWSESIAVGSESFIKDIQQKLAGRVKGRLVVTYNGTTALKEPQAPYSILLASQKSTVRLKNTYVLPIRH